MTSKRSMKSAFESMMFIWGEPLNVRLAAEIFNIDWKEAYECFRDLQKEYDEQERGIRIRETDKSFQFVTLADNSEYIERLCTPVKQRKLTQSALEVLAIIAYKQPVTRGEIETIRGIRCERVLEGLQSKGLVEETGRSSGIGRPILYGTTGEFLKHFGFSSIKELPDIEDIESAIENEEPKDMVDLQQISIDMPEE